MTKECQLILRYSCQALFDKSSAQTSERPRWIVSNEQLCNKWNVLLLPASDARWKVSRTAKKSRGKH